MNNSKTDFQNIIHQVITEMFLNSGVSNLYLYKSSRDSKVFGTASHFKLSFQFKKDSYYSPTDSEREGRGRI